MKLNPFAKKSVDHLFDADLKTKKKADRTLSIETTARQTGFHLPNYDRKLARTSL